MHYFIRSYYIIPGVFFTDQDEDSVFVRILSDEVDLSEQVGQRRFTGCINCELLIFFGVDGSCTFFCRLWAIKVALI